MVRKPRIEIVNIWTKWGVVITAIGVITGVVIPIAVVFIQEYVQQNIKRSSIDTAIQKELDVNEEAISPTQKPPEGLPPLADPKFWYNQPINNLHEETWKSLGPEAAKLSDKYNQYIQLYAKIEQIETLSSILQGKSPEVVPGQWDTIVSKGYLSQAAQDYMHLFESLNS